MSVETTGKESGSVKHQLIGLSLFGALVGGSIYARRNPDQVAKLGQEALKHLNILYSAALPYAKYGYHYAAGACGRFINAAKGQFAEWLNQAKATAIPFEKR